MAKQLGRKIIITRDAAPIANVRTKSLSINREPIDVTDDDSAGWREILDEPGQMEINMTVEGVFASDSILQEAMSTSTGLTAHTLTFADGGALTGSFALASFELEGAYNEAATYSFEIQSSGVITYTPAA